MIENLRIDALAYGGSGVGRHEGKAIFVPFTAPGDLIRCRIVRDKKRYAEGEVAELLSPSPDRRDPPCPVFGECGGCQWQHLPYEEQCRWKERIFADTLSRRCAVAEEFLRPLVPSPDEWGYRSRVQFKCRQTEQGFVMGFYRQGSHFVIDVPHCPVLHPRLNEALRFFRQRLPESPCPDKIPQVDMAVGDNGRVRVVIHFIGRKRDPLVTYLQTLGGQGGFSLFLQTGRKETLCFVAGEEDLAIHVDNPLLRLAYGPGGFAQVNLAQNRALVEEVVRGAQLTGKERVLDLFCGMGNFTLPLARHAAEAVGVEDYGPSIKKAMQNALFNGIDNVFFHAHSAQGAAARHLDGRGFDLVVLDPPRTGAYEVAKELLSALPRRIMYVSCDPSTLARDLMPLLHGGYTLLWSRPFDLFPQTYHIESVTLLERQ
jgi:23S rRNA (uracil1939-C5)-methyltransferase